MVCSDARITLRVPRQAGRGLTPATGNSRNPNWEIEPLQFIRHLDFVILSSFDIRHSSFISRLPPERVLQNRLVSRQFVRRPVVSERDADNPGPGMFHGPD